MQILRCAHRQFDIIHGVQPGDYGILKTSALITINASQNPIGIKAFVD